MRGVLLDPRTGKKEGHACVPRSSEVEAWEKAVDRRLYEERTRDLINRSDDFHNTTTTNRYLCYPTAAAGITRASSGGAAWSFSAYTVLVPTSTITATYYIAGFCCQLPAASAVTTTFEYQMELATGATGSEVTIIQIPAVVRNVTAAGYQPPFWCVFPEPKQIAANTQISFRFAQSLATTSQTISGIKIMYETA